MATPATIRGNRKKSLRIVRANLRALDSQLEITERLIQRVLRVRKRFPDEEDAIAIIEGLREMDSLLSKVATKAIDFSRLVRTF